MEQKLKSTTTTTKIISEIQDLVQTYEVRKQEIENTIVTLEKIFSDISFKEFEGESLILELEDVDNANEELVLNKTGLTIRRYFDKLDSYTSITNTSFENKKIILGGLGDIFEQVKKSLEDGIIEFAMYDREIQKVNQMLEMIKRNE